VLRLPPVDILVLILYLVGLTGYGCWFYRKRQGSEEFMVAGRSLPGWAVGLSIFGSYVSSISFLANPGKAFGGNWNPFVFSLSLPLAAWISTRYFVPFYRKLGDVSAYHHLEHRFGGWARSYAVACYLLTQLARMGTILYLLGLALVPLLGWDIRAIILLMGLVMIAYPLLGGTEGVIWVGVVQAVTLVAGAVICLLFPILQMQEGRRRCSASRQNIISSAWAATGQPDGADLLGGARLRPVHQPAELRDRPELCPALHYGAVGPGGGAQRVDRRAALHPALGGFLPDRHALFAFYTAQPASSTPGRSRTPCCRGSSDPASAGLASVIVAAICAAALDSNLNCMATLTLCDLYRRYLRPQASERESMRVLWEQRSCSASWGQGPPWR
jgi:SSS family solute:Na+ symporter